MDGGVGGRHAGRDIGPRHPLARDVQAAITHFATIAVRQGARIRCDFGQGRGVQRRLDSLSQAEREFHPADLAGPEPAQHPAIGRVLRGGLAGPSSPE